MKRFRSIRIFLMKKAVSPRGDTAGISLMGRAILFGSGDRIFAELLEKLLKLEGYLAGTGTCSLVTRLYLCGCIFSECLKTGGDVFYEIFH